MTQVAVLGAGRIGLPVVVDLVRAGHHVRVFDIRAEPKAAAIEAGARWAATASAAVDGADVLLTVLPGSPELAALMLGEEGGTGLIARLAPGLAWVDLTSAAPELDDELGRAARAHGVGHLDAGVGGDVRAAEQARLTLYVGGDPALLDRVRPLLEAIASPDRIHHMGAEGTGHLAKLLVNLLWFGQAIATAEALLLAGRAGLDPQRLREVLLAGPAASEFIATQLPRLLAGDYLTSFGLARCVEQLDSIERLAREHSVPFEVSAQVARTHRDALNDFGPVDGELMGVAHLERLAGELIRTRQSATES